ncbi:MAG: TetR/AcrR family transcriptional regulator [Candidatus Binatia bacterium]
MSDTISESQFTSQPTTVSLSRRERKKERTRQEIYRAAMELFLARGFDAVTVEDICAVADVAKGTFFLHFSTKDALLLEYGRETTRELEELLHTHQGGATAALQKILASLAERAARHAAIVQLLARELLSRPTTLANVTEQTRDLGQLFVKIVQQAQTAEELRKDIDPRLAAAIITAAYFAIVGEWARRGGKFDLPSAIQQSLDVVLNGMAEKQALSKAKKKQS